MWHRLLGALVIVCGLALVVYLGWCQRRLSMPVLLSDAAWPRSWPYPDRWLERWLDRLEKEHPTPPGYIKPEGELYRLMGRLNACTLSAVGLIALGVVILFWPQIARRSCWASVLRGVAIGLVVGINWTAFLGHMSDGRPPEWSWLAVNAVGLALTGAVVGAVQRHRELVGFFVGPLELVFLAAHVRPDVYLARHSLWGLPLCVSEWLACLVGVNRDLSWLVVFGGTGLLCGPVVGCLHRLLSPNGPRSGRLALASRH
jgi:hypothetical protein